MHLGIDASNIRQGGGVTHLVQLLSAASPLEQGVSKITIWCSPQLGKLLPTRQWLNVQSDNWLTGGSLKRLLFQHLFLSLEMRRAGCEIAFFPGSTLPLINLLPAVTISQNMLPFELDKAALFGKCSLMYMKMLVLRCLQSISFKRAVGVIFLSQYAQNKINQCIKINGLQALIPHGIEARFIGSPRPQKPIEAYSMAEPFRFLYVSILMPYKHQIEVIRAIKGLRDDGVPVELSLIGPSWGWYGKAVQRELKRLDPEDSFLHYLGEMPFEELHEAYQTSDAFIFASSCENLPNILIEAMASGIPVACSSMGPMSEVLKANGFYLSSMLPFAIEAGLKEMLWNKGLRAKFAEASFRRAKLYLWESCATASFEFIRECHMIEESS